MIPLELLENKLAEYRVALIKSKEALDAGKITASHHLMHKINLEKIIAEYKYAIRILTTYM